MGKSPSDRRQRLGGEPPTRLSICGNRPLSPRSPLSPVGRLPAYGKLAYGHLPTGLGKPLRGFPQAPSLDDDEQPLDSVRFSDEATGRTKMVDAGQLALLLRVVG